MSADWRKALEAGGGVEAAMLYGPPLAALVAEVERLEAKAAESDTLRWNAVASAVEAGERAAASERLLAIERAEVVRLSNLVEPIQRRLVAVEEVVAAAKNEATKGVVTARLTAALAALDQEVTHE